MLENLDYGTGLRTVDGTRALYLGFVETYGHIISLEGHQATYWYNDDGTPVFDGEFKEKYTIISKE